MAKLDTIVGLELRYIELLHSAGIQSIEHLLKAGGTPESRKELAEKTGFRLKHIENWVMRADLARVTGIGGEYADLLQRVGVNTITELTTQDPPDLYARLQAFNKSKRLVRRVPSLSFVTQWISEAQKLRTIVTL